MSTSIGSRCHCCATLESNSRLDFLTDEGIQASCPCRYWTSFLTILSQLPPPPPMFNKALNDSTLLNTERASIEAKRPLIISSVKEEMYHSNTHQNASCVLPT